MPFLVRCPACNQPGIRLFARGLYSRQMNRKCLFCERAIHSEISRWHYEIAKWVVALLGTLLALALFFTVFAGEWVITGLLIGVFTAINTAWMCRLHVRGFRLPAAEVSQAAPSK